MGRSFVIAALAIALAFAFRPAPALATDGMIPPASEEIGNPGPPYVAPEPVCDYWCYMGEVIQRLFEPREIDVGSGAPRG